MHDEGRTASGRGSGRRARCVAALVAACALRACVSRPTVIVVSVDSDVPATEPLALQVRASRGAVVPGGDAAAALAIRRDDGGALRLPASFGVVPERGVPPDTTVTLLLELETPSARLRRIARVAFVPHATVSLRIFFALGCAAAAPDSDCSHAGLSAGCQVQEVCERRGMTCGNDGRCSEVITPIEPGPDVVTPLDMPTPPPPPPPPHCGALGESCCAGDTCELGSVCGVHGGTCEACGGTGQLCCAGDICHASNVCAGGRCQCGGRDQPCCPGDACDPMLLCIASAGGGSTCQCGARNQVCCNGTTCGAGLLCTATGFGPICLCGGRNQVCCGGTTCDPGALCTATGFGPVCLCGGRNQVCCNGTTCDASLLCTATGFGPICLCGGRNQVCCAGNMCDPGTLCTATGFGPICLCGGDHQVCCGGTTCNAGFRCTATGFGPVCL